MDWWAVVDRFAIPFVTTFAMAFAVPFLVFGFFYAAGAGLYMGAAFGYRLSKNSITFGLFIHNLPHIGIAQVVESVEVDGALPGERPPKNKQN